MKIVWTQRSFHPNFGTSKHDDMSAGIIEVDSKKEAIQRIRLELVGFIKYSYDTEDEAEIIEIIDELKPIMPDEERNWGELYDEDNGYQMTYVIIDD